LDSYEEQACLNNVGSTDPHQTPGVQSHAVASLQHDCKALQHQQYELQLGLNAQRAKSMWRLATGCQAPTDPSLAGHSVASALKAATLYYHPMKV